jgi:Cu/Ag efflux protein CusF
MNKKIVSLALAMVFALSTAGVGFAAKLKCTVDAVDVETGKVTMTCEKADKLEVGAKVKVSVKKKGAIEGC